MNRQTLKTQGSAQPIDNIRAAKELADAYGIEVLERLIRLAESDRNLLHNQPTPAKEDILQEVETAGFELNPWLEDLILDADVKVVRDAIAVVKENRRRGITVWNPEGLLVSAIRNQWKPNIPL
ncbi:hypothetical protein [Microseira sp. BLCC-F43]|jgi:hypothetical protein|uniref:hypothetical protein n=1 Tax=Microseira sp. BLCC-F43 TaxID=3153602 RepID=UPI0035BACF2B